MHQAHGSVAISKLAVPTSTSCDVRTFMIPGTKERLDHLTTQKLRKIDDLPDAIGLYGLADHIGDIHYIGITAAKSFADRIYQRHVNGSEERSHKLACNYNIGRMWRDRKCSAHVPHDAKIAKD